MLLGSYPEFSSNDTSEIESSIRLNAGGASFDVPRKRDNLFFQANAARFSDVSLIWLSFNAAAVIRFQPVTYARKVFQIDKISRITVGGACLDSAPGDSGYLVPDGAPWQAEHNQGFQNLSLRCEVAALKRKLMWMTDSSRSDSLQFVDQGNDRAAGYQHLRTAVFHFASEIEHAGHWLSTIALIELQKAMLLRFLLYTRHSCTELLEKEPSSPSEIQVRRVEEYIAANWDKPLDIESLALVAQISGRSLFRAFRKMRGYSPYEFIRRQRLDRARAALLSNTETGSVMSVAMRCGFSSLGHFAKAYRMQFGELPSQTVHRLARD